MPPLHRRPGGFAFGGLVQPAPDAPTLDLALYVVSCFAVHACTCSALTSAILFRVLHSLHDDEVDRWASSNKWLLRMPMIKFGMGCPAYLFSVILTSWSQLDDHQGAQLMAFAIGASSVSMVLATAFLVTVGPSRVAAYDYKVQQMTKI